MTFEELLAGVGEKVGARIEAQGDLCVVEVDGCPVVMRHLPETSELLVFGEIGATPPEIEADMMRILLAGNHLFVATGGATISRNGENGPFCLERRDMIDVLPFDRWWAAFGQFLDSLANWRNFVANGQTPNKKISSDDCNLPQMWA